MPTGVPQLPRLSPERIQTAAVKVSAGLLSEATPAGHWSGELSASALSTATAIAAISAAEQDENSASSMHPGLLSRGINWLADHQNPDGGWGDTDRSQSNISTTMLVRAAFRLAGADPEFADIIDKAERYLNAQGGVDAVHARYGKDRTFSAPILTQCALAGLVSWNEVAALPFELGCLPHQFYKLVRLPVVSYALPALIAIGQIRHTKAPSHHPLIYRMRQAAIEPTLRLLSKIQPESGGYLEATPLTSFVVMSLLGMNRSSHPVVASGLQFLRNSVRADGSWPIDTNLATWVTTLTIQALDLNSIPTEQAHALTDWLLGQQLKKTHPYTQAAPGGWAWTDLSGGVPDADDTPGAILALLKLSERTGQGERCLQATSAGIDWLLDLQNRDHGWPTFCRGWGALPFDRSAADITAHAIRALIRWQKAAAGSPLLDSRRQSRIGHVIQTGFQYLRSEQRPDGSWLPLWFGNQHAPDDINPVYGTSRILLAYRDWEADTHPSAVRGNEWLLSQQNADGGWGGIAGAPSTVEETSLALDALLAPQSIQTTPIQNGLSWLIDQVDLSPEILPAAPIGFYFAKLWYYERLYPQIFAASALRRAGQLVELQ